MTFVGTATIPTPDPLSFINVSRLLALPGAFFIQLVVRLDHGTSGALPVKGTID